MNFSEQTKSWIMLLALVFSSGAAVFVTSILGGEKTWLAAITALGVAGTNIYHALSPRPKDKNSNTQTFTNPNP